MYKQRLGRDQLGRSASITASVQWHCPHFNLAANPFAFSCDSRRPIISFATTNSTAWRSAVDHQRQAAGAILTTAREDDCAEQLSEKGPCGPNVKTLSALAASRASGPAPRSRLPAPGAMFLLPGQVRCRS